MKVLFLTSMYGNASGGTRYDAQFIRRLEQNDGFDIKIITDSDLNVSSRQAARKSYAEVFKNTDFGVFITNSRLYTRFYGLIKILKKKGVYCVVFHHHYNFMTRQGYKRVIHKKLEISTLNSFDAVVHASEYVHNLSKGLLSNRVKSYFIPVANEELEISKVSNLEGNMFSYVGNIEPRKGIHFLIEACAILKNKGTEFKLNLIGDTNYDLDYYRRLEELVRRYDLENDVRFCGRLPLEEKDCILLQSMCFVFPSLLEGLGLAMLEAMAKGLPVIAFDNSAMPYTVKNGENGLLASNKDAGSLAAMMSRILNDRELRVVLSKGAINTVRQYPALNHFNLQVDDFGTRLSEIGGTK